MKYLHCNNSFYLNVLVRSHNTRGRQCRQAMRTRLCGGLPADLSFCYFLVKQKVEKENMNGRLYDPVIGRFFSPDNIVQLPEFSQSFNRYSYCLNNPLKCTDPSGQTWYDVRGKRKFIDDGVDDDMTIKVSQMQFRRLERRFENDRNYEAYRNKLADINGYTTTHTIFGKFSEFSRNGNGTEVLPGVEVRWHRPNDAPGAARQDYSGFFGHLNYFWNGGIADGYKHNIDGQVIGFAPLMGTPPVPAFKGGNMIKGLKTLQTGGNTLKPETLKALGLTQEQGKRAIEALKKSNDRLRNNTHYKIKADGSLVNPHTGEIIDNILYYVY